MLARMENHESYRKVAKDYGVSHETIRRFVRALQQATSLKDFPSLSN